MQCSVCSPCCQKAKSCLKTSEKSESEREREKERQEYPNFRGKGRVKFLFSFLSSLSPSHFLLTEEGEAKRKVLLLSWE